MDNKSKRIGSFKNFLQQQNKQRLNEARVSLEIEWWDPCIAEVMQIMKDECAGFLDYETLVNYVKGKFQILGRPDPEYDEGFLLQHIKDLIFQLHGDSFVCDGMCSWGDTSEIQAKGLVVSELAKVILDKVMETIKSPDDPSLGRQESAWLTGRNKRMSQTLPLMTMGQLNMKKTFLMSMRAIR